MPVLELEEAACKSQDYDSGSHGELPHQAGVPEYPVHIYPLTHTVLLEEPTPISLAWRGSTATLFGRTTCIRNLDVCGIFAGMA